ncbi:hypothetical protein ICN49_08835 [Polynucleobacter sp. MWH-Mekk-B1]|uniref:hypothetical protein n=1 Tax=Polynucleobacter finlandensis TaxID=1855894 RepID=UPI001C0CDE83|nr:hypothetical protein [Polynucleobacter finlandensis]MBU3545021.1 hypothetical protein [Polynucleobacter finlandensis]
MKRYSLALLIGFALAGCGGDGYQQEKLAPKLSPSQKLSNAYSEAIKNSNQQAKQCSDTLGNSDEGKLVRKEILFANQKDEYAQGLMGSKQHLNSKQTVALEKYIIGQKSCRGVRLNALNKVPFLPTVWIEYYKKMDGLSSQLLSKKITIGEANQQSVNFLQERNVNINEARLKITSELSAMQQQETILALKQQGVAAQQAQVEATKRANDRLLWKDINDSLKPQWLDSSPSCLGPGCK